MSKVLFFFVLYIFSISSLAQTWEHTIGEPGVSEIFSHIDESYDNGYLIITGKDYYPSTKGWILKTDINGNLLYEIALGNGTGNIQANYPQFIEKTQDGGMIICGSYDEWSMNDIYIAKLDVCAELEWCKVFRTDENPDWGLVVHQLPDWGYILLSIQYAGLDLEDDIHLFRFDENGQLLWIQEYGSINEHPLIRYPDPWDVLITDKNDFFISGTCYWYDSLTNVSWPKSLSILVDNLNYEKWLSAYQDINNLTNTASIFSIQKGSGNFYLGSCDNNNFTSKLLVVDSLGNYIHDSNPSLPILQDKWAEGYLLDPRFSDNESLYAYTQYVDSSGAYNPWIGIHELDSLGGWYNTFLHNSFPPARMDITEDQKIIFGSNVGWALGQDISLIKLNMSLQYDSLYTVQRVYDYLCPDSIVSKTIDLSPCEVIVDVKDVPNREEYNRSVNRIFITPAPNPADDYITFKLKNTEHHRNIRLIIYDIFGNELKTLPVNSGKDETGCEISWLTPGIYMAVSYAGNRIVGSARFVVQ